MWQPTAAAHEVYRDLVTNHINEQIVTTFGYLGKKTLALVWVWGGQRFTYGNNLDMQITLLSELSGLINADTRSTSNNADYSMSMIEAIRKTEKYYNVDKYDIVKFSEKAATDLKTAKIQNQYGKDQTFVGEVNKIIKENGNYVFSTNILTNPAEQQTSYSANPSSKLVIFTPFSYEDDADTVLDGATRSPSAGPDPTKRYGYLLGPSMFNTLERSFQWAPPQQISQPTPAKTSNPVKRTRRNKGPKTPVTSNINKVSGPGGSVQGTSSASTNPGIRVQLDKVGPDKQILQQLESSSVLNLHTFLVPALVGIKPYDIVYVPSLNAQDTTDIEDWIVTSVDYNQTDGGVEVSITATRPYGTGATLMNETSGAKFLEKARTLTTLGSWESYAWGIDIPVAIPNENPVSSNTGFPAGRGPNGSDISSVVSGQSVIGSAIVAADGKSYVFQPAVRAIPFPEGGSGIIDPATNLDLRRENWLYYNPNKRTLEYYTNYNNSGVPTEKPTAILPANSEIVATDRKLLLRQ